MAAFFVGSPQFSVEWHWEEGKVSWRKHRPPEPRSRRRAAAA